ncbi:hypothetical protein K491DRAFT_764161 [Lophiostoma macrostomum CBS 122681]|uniref:Transcriptional regulator Ngg1 n=1 Tax=Lophiostoma macrostomum CBS 122681 TaxID=1314788 RepID=A0A6A6TUS2_9PLEO|nr:hypothetical protein K491DRAFT_764161 [Lophiostoma macrostomum CBS 122681]
MPSVSSKGKAKPSSKPSAPPRSRNTTPLPPSNARVSVEPASASSYFRASMTSLSKDSDVPSVEEILDRGGSVSQIPPGALLHSMRESIQKTILGHYKKRGEDSDRLLRELQKMRSQNQRNAHEREQKRERAAEREGEERKHKLKKIKKREPDEDRPPAVGAHGVARQDGVDVHKGEPTFTSLSFGPRRRRLLRASRRLPLPSSLTEGAEPSSTVSSPISQPPPSATGTGPADAPSPSISEASHQPAPAPAIPTFQTFGPDPSKFDDPTIYHIREILPGMSEEEIKEIYCVAEYPASDLHELTPGTPPEKDFSNAKPASQVNATVFANYVEPYIRPLTEEDVAFLKERGDRTSVFLLPSRGPRHYKELWADEDGAMHLDTNDNRLPPNEARGSAEDMSDEMLTSEAISAGPLLSRLLSVLRPEGRGSQKHNEDTNGLNGDAMDIDEGAGVPVDVSNNNSLPAAAQLSEFLQPGWKAPLPPTRTDYAGFEDRMMLELKHYGMVSDTDESKALYDHHFDDEISARLRLLQGELRKQSVINGARKQRLLELTEERMAQQEYNTIADDLDNQLNAAYLKRNRNMGKGKKNTKRPGGAGGGSHPVANAGISRPGVGEPIRTLMERKSQWNNTIGPVVNYGKTSLPRESIFPEDKMKVLEDKEIEGFDPEEAE